MISPFSTPFLLSEHPTTGIGLAAFSIYASVLTTRGITSADAFVKLADEVLGLERPSRTSLAELRSFHKQEGIPVPKPLEDLDPDNYRLVKPKRTRYEKRLIEACHFIDWSKWLVGASFLKFSSRCFFRSVSSRSCG